MADGGVLGYDEMLSQSFQSALSSTGAGSKDMSKEVHRKKVGRVQ